jgi:FdhD protein
MNVRFVRSHIGQAWRGDRVSGGVRAIPEETALALTYNGGTYAVMMGTPCDLEDFAIGFSLNAGIVESADAIESLETVRVENGIERRMWLARVKAARLSERRRHIAGPTGRGLCGIDSIAEAVGPAAIVGPGPTCSTAACPSLPALKSVRHRPRLCLRVQTNERISSFVPQTEVNGLFDHVVLVFHRQILQSAEI